MKEIKKILLDSRVLSKIFASARLDDVLAMISHKEFRSGKSFLVYGPPGEGREIILYKYAKMLFQKKNTIVWITTNKSASKVKEVFEEFHQDVDFWKKYGNMISFIDLFSETVGLPHQDTDVTYIDSPSRLELLLTELNEVTQRTNADMVVIDSISGFLKYSSSGAILKFLGILIARMSNKGISNIYTLNEGEHDARVQMAIESMVDFICHAKDSKFRVKAASYPVKPVVWDIKV